jgi:hypothetical protein
LNKVKKTIVANASTHSAEPIITDSNQTGPDGNGKGKPNILRVITYHRVANLDDDHLLNPRLISATPEVFALQIEHVANNYNAVSIDQVLDVIMNGGQLPDRAVLITFDDAYYDLTEHAWPILKRFQLPGRKDVFGGIGSIGHLFIRQNPYWKRPLSDRCPYERETSGLET